MTFVDDEIDEEKQQIPFGNLEEPSQRYRDHGQDNHDRGAHLGRAGQERKMDPQGMIRLAEQTAVGEGK